MEQKKKKKKAAFGARASWDRQINSCTHTFFFAAKFSINIYTIRTPLH